MKIIGCDFHTRYQQIGGWRSLLRRFLVSGARSFPVCGKGRGFGHPRGPVFDSSLVPDSFLILLPHTGSIRTHPSLLPS